MKLKILFLGLLLPLLCGCPPKENKFTLNGEYLVYLSDENNGNFQVFAINCVQKGREVKIYSRERITLPDGSQFQPLVLKLGGWISQSVLTDASGTELKIDFNKAERIEGKICISSKFKNFRAFKIEREIKDCPDWDKTYDYYIYNQMADYEGILEIKGEKMTFDGTTCEINKMAIVSGGSVAYYGFEARKDNLIYYVFYNGMNGFTGVMCYNAYVYFFLEAIESE